MPSFRVLSTFCALTALAACSSSSSVDPVPVTHYLVVLPVASGRGAGIVSGPGGVNCTFTATVTSGACSVSILEGTSVPLTATPTGEAEFATWGGDCTGPSTCTVVMSSDRAVTARFVDAFTVAILPAAGATGTGTVTSNPAGIDCVLTAGVGTGSCSAKFPDETAIIITAAPAAGSIFLGWSGAGTCATSLACVVPLASSHTVTAAFGPVP